MFNASEDREKRLLAEVARGNEIAYAELFHTYRTKLYSFIFRISGSRQAAEDVVQDVFVKIWQTKTNLVQVENFNLYIFRIARNHILNSMKRMAKETLILSEISLRSKNMDEKIYGHIDYKELHRLFSLAVEELPCRQKMVFLLSKEQGMKQEEISKRLNISIVTVKSHMTQAFRLIRKKIKSSYLEMSLCILFVLPGW